MGKLLYARPMMLHFSLYYPPINASNHNAITADVLQPLIEVLCNNRFYLVSTGPQIESSLCGPTSGFDPADKFYGDINASVLMQAPVIVNDELLGNFRWTSWRVIYYAMQMGQPMMEMATSVMDMTTSNPPSLNTTYLNDPNGQTFSVYQLATVMNDVLQLALQTTIQEGDMDNSLGPKYPGIHASLYGAEVATWKPFGIFPPSSGTGASLSSVSAMVNTLKHSHGLRYVGAGFIILLWVLVEGLHRLAVNRRIQRQYKIQQGEKEKHNIRFASEDDVTSMLNLGRNQMFRSWKKSTSQSRKNGAQRVVVVPNSRMVSA